MKIKSYYSRSVEAAMATARQEMGSEAMLVNSRKTPIEARHLGEYEVVFALAGASDSPQEASLQLAGEFASPPAASSAPGASSGASASSANSGSSAFNGSSGFSSYNASSSSSVISDRVSIEVAALKKELEGMRQAITRTAYAPAQWVGVSQDISDAYAALSGAEVSPELAREIVQAAGSRVGSARVPASRIPQRVDGQAFRRALSEELTSRFTVDASLGRPGAQTRIVALVGPPGSGKTSTLVKLAVNYGLAARKPVLLLSTDTNRIAAADQLRSYASILGVAFQVLETVGALAQAIEENRGKELIFIDTPGLAPSELADADQLTRFLSTRTDIDTHLVLPASMKPADLARMVDAFQVLRPDHLLFTRLDETSSYGPIFTEAARTSKPLSFFCWGQRIPEDLEAATGERLLDLVWKERGGNLKSSAA
jgi:flagellar biosynthesis protein FlhF